MESTNSLREGRLLDGAPSGESIRRSIARRALATPGTLPFRTPKERELTDEPATFPPHN